ncbi:hypothetical protein GOODEAATRI_015764 [Goodea atripinnis]|uniref:Uncharacterized protein n=1 Tax=Goodea atripinnis TaxID=208336 RepID=A0ABV0NUV3_9TELE
MVMHMRPPTTGPFPSPIQRPVMQVNKPVIIRSPPYPNPGRDPSHSTPSSVPEPPVKGPEDGMKMNPKPRAWTSRRGSRQSFRLGRLQQADDALSEFGWSPVRMRRNSDAASEMSCNW